MHSCSSILEFIKLVGEKNNMLGKAFSPHTYIINLIIHKHARSLFNQKYWCSAKNNRSLFMHFSHGIHVWNYLGSLQTHFARADLLIIYILVFKRSISEFWFVCERNPKEGLGRVFHIFFINQVEAKMGKFSSMNA